MIGKWEALYIYVDLGTESANLGTPDPQNWGFPYLHETGVRAYGLVCELGGSAWRHAQPETFKCTEIDSEAILGPKYNLRR